MKFFLLLTLADALPGLQREGAIYHLSVEAVARLLCFAVMCWLPSLGEGGVEDMIVTTPLVEMLA